jgi:hypothetical protein
MASLAPEMQTWLTARMQEITEEIHAIQTADELPALLGRLYRLARLTERVDMAVSAWAMLEGGMTRGAAARAIGITTGAASSRAGNVQANADIRDAFQR